MARRIFFGRGGVSSSGQVIKPTITNTQISAPSTPSGGGGGSNSASSAGVINTSVPAGSNATVQGSGLGGVDFSRSPAAESIRQATALQTQQQLASQQVSGQSSGLAGVTQKQLAEQITVQERQASNAYQTGTLQQQQEILRAPTTNQERIRSLGQVGQMAQAQQDLQIAQIVQTGGTTREQFEQSFAAKKKAVEMPAQIQPTNNIPEDRVSINTPEGTLNIFPTSAISRMFSGGTTTPQERTKLSTGEIFDTTPKTVQQRLQEQAQPPEQQNQGFNYLRSIQTGPLPTARAEQPTTPPAPTKPEDFIGQGTPIETIKARIAGTEPTPPEVIQGREPTDQKSFFQTLIQTPLVPYTKEQATTFLKPIITPIIQRILEPYSPGQTQDEQQRLDEQNKKAGDFLSGIAGGLITPTKTDVALAILTAGTSEVLDIVAKPTEAIAEKVLPTVAEGLAKYVPTITKTAAGIYLTAPYALEKTSEFITAQTPEEKGQVISEPLKIGLLAGAITDITKSGYNLIKEGFDFIKTKTGFQKPSTETPTPETPRSTSTTSQSQTKDLLQTLKEATPEQAKEIYKQVPAEQRADLLKQIPTQGGQRINLAKKFGALAVGAVAGYELLSSKDKRDLSISAIPALALSTDLIDLGNKPSKEITLPTSKEIAMPNIFETALTKIKETPLPAIFTTQPKKVPDIFKQKELIQTRKNLPDIFKQKELIQTRKNLPDMLQKPKTNLPDILKPKPITKRPINPPAIIPKPTLPMIPPPKNLPTKINKLGEIIPKQKNLPLKIIDETKPLKPEPPKDITDELLKGGGLPKISLPGFNLGGFPKFAREGHVQQRSYAPSVRALILGLRGKQPRGSTLSGFEERTLPTSKTRGLSVAAKLSLGIPVRRGALNKMVATFGERAIKQGSKRFSRLKSFNKQTPKQIKTLSQRDTEYAPRTRGALKNILTGQNRKEGFRVLAKTILRPESVKVYSTRIKKEKSYYKKHKKKISLF